MLRLPLALFAALFLAGAAGPTPAAPATGSARDAAVEVQIESPEPGASVRNRVHLAPIRGSASARAGGPPRFEVMLAIDVSQSTRVASGADVDGDGVTGVDPAVELIPAGTYPDDVRSTDPDDTILAAEVAAARALLESLDRERVRVGLITFSGEVHPVTNQQKRPDQKDARLEVPLTRDFARLEAALGAIRARGSHGATNFAAGIRLAITELASLSGARSRTDPDARKVLLFLTDGKPTFPIGKAVVSDPGDVEAAVNAANLAQAAGITINTYALGPAALTNPIAPTEMARVTLGTFTPVMNPGDIVVLLQSVSFANIEDVVIANLTTQDFSSDVRLAPDGSFRGFVPVREGHNRVRVTALASDGSRGSVELDLDFELAGLSDRELARELERVQRRNAELQRLLELERIEEFRKEQKKVLELEREASPEPPDGSGEEDGRSAPEE